MNEEKRKPVYCPMCGTELGKINKKRYYCMNCDYEVVIHKGKMSVYKISVNGYLSKVAVFNYEQPEEKKENPPKRKGIRYVVQIDKDTMQEINRFNSQKEASKITGVCCSGISNCVNKRAKLAGGYVWRYIYV